MAPVSSVINKAKTNGSGIHRFMVSAKKYPVRLSKITFLISVKVMVFGDYNVNLVSGVLQIVRWSNGGTITDIHKVIAIESGSKVKLGARLVKTDNNGITLRGKTSRKRM